MKYFKITLISILILLQGSLNLYAQDDFAPLDLGTGDVEDFSPLNLDEELSSEDFKPIDLNEPIEEPQKTDRRKYESSLSELLDLNNEKTQKMYIIFFLLLFGIIISKKYTKRSIRLRYITMLISLSLLGFYFGGCICTIGVLQKVIIDIANFRIDYILISIMFIVLLSTFLFGKIFCGYACPIGALQDFLFRKSLSFKISKKVHNVLKYFKYLVLVLVVIFSVILNKMVLMDIEPFKVAFNFGGTIIQIILFVIFVVASLFIFRPWCKYFCPLGALLSIVSKLGLASDYIVNNCRNCSLCKKECDYNAIIENNIIDKAECIQCGLCKVKCPNKT